MRCISVPSINAALALMCATPSLAEVTADDVWANLKASTEAMGGQISATATRAGNQLEIGAASISFQLPLDAGDLRIETSGMTLVENGDGTVDLVYPSTFDYAIVLNRADEVIGSVELVLDTSDYTTTAEGKPGGITYTYVWDDGGFQLGKLNVPKLPQMALDMTGTVTGMRGTYQIIEGELMRFRMTSDAGDMRLDMKMTDDLGIVSTSTQTHSGGSSVMTMTIPTGKVNILNLSQALRDGLALSGDAQGTRVEATDQSSIDGEVISVEKYGYLTDTLSYSLDKSGFVAAARHSDFWMEVEFSEFLPVPVKARADAIAASVSMPLNQSGGPADAALGMTVDALTLETTFGLSLIPRHNCRVIRPICSWMSQAKWNCLWTCSISTH